MVWCDGGILLVKEVIIKRSVVESVLSYAQMFHPKESILLLKGKDEKKR